MVLIGSQYRCSEKGDTGGKASSRVASFGSLTGKTPISGVFTCRRVAQSRHRCPINHQWQQHGLVRCAATCASHSSIMLFLDSASLSSWDTFSSTRMFTGMSQVPLALRL